MLATHSKPRDIYKTFAYDLNKSGAKAIGGNMAGEDLRELSQEILIAQPLNRRVQRPIYHGALSLPVGDYLSNELWNIIAQDFLDEMGFVGHPYQLTRHTDQDHDHIHFTAGRIGLNGRCVHDGWDHRKAEVTLRKIEQRYELPSITCSWDTLEVAPSFAEQHRYEQEQHAYEQGIRSIPPALSVRKQLLTAIQTYTQDAPTMPELVKRLQQGGIEVKINLKHPGISFQLNNVKFRGYRLGRAYSFNGLQKHQRVSYIPGRDDEQIQQLMQQPAKSISTTTEATIGLLPNSDSQTLLPERKDANWNQVKQQLVTQYQFPPELLDGLYHQGWLYADQNKRPVFVERSLDDDNYHGLTLNSHGILEATEPNLEHHLYSTFWIGDDDLPLQEAVIVEHPLEALAVYVLEKVNNPNSQPTLYLSADRPEQLPLNVLKDMERVYISVQCTDAIKTHLNQQVPQAVGIDPHHPQGWQGIWREEVKTSQQQTASRRSLKPQRQRKQIEP
ncbi:MAG: relaxase/mobilization nuclease domain-containing protein [Oculatellaceae cyanobacterium bins.114]|nr:relaxase/mobilization nuclease domain-containing protein [Oculatellaceae cyanobacterium bins.114]